jgi:hypothetical protein
MSHYYLGLLPGSKMKSRAYFIFPLALIAAALLAFLLRGAVKEWIILPLARFFWLVKGYYGAFPQAAYWVVVLGIAVLVSLLGFHLPDIERRLPQDQWKPLPGSIREMSFWIQRSKGGIFPKWHIAHLLAELALDILDRQGTRQKQARRLTGSDWVPPAEVKKYLDAALTTNYTDYPKPKRFGSLPPTPFDQDLEPVIKYLESLLESEHDHHS